MYHDVMRTPTGSSYQLLPDMSSFTQDDDQLSLSESSWL
jgi:hypothetical protein